MINDDRVGAGRHLKLFSCEASNPGLYRVVLMMEVKSLTWTHTWSLVSPYHRAASVTADYRNLVSPLSRMPPRDDLCRRCC